MITLKKDAIKYRDPQTGEFVGVNMIGGTASSSGGGADFEVDETLTLEDGVLSVNTVDAVEENNTNPVTSGAVYKEIGNISALLATI